MREACRRRSSPQPRPFCVYDCIQRQALKSSHPQAMRPRCSPLRPGSPVRTNYNRPLANANRAPGSVARIGTNQSAMTGGQSKTCQASAYAYPEMDRSGYQTPRSDGCESDEQARLAAIKYAFRRCRTSRSNGWPRNAHPKVSGGQVVAIQLIQTTGPPVAVRYNVSLALGNAFGVHPGPGRLLQPA